MRRRIAVYGATDEALALLPALARRRDLELVCVVDPEARVLRRRLALIEPGAARLLQQTLGDDPRALLGPPGLAVVIDGGLASPPQVPPAAELLSPAEAAVRLRLPPSRWREPTAPDGPRPDPASLPARLERAIGEGRRLALLRCDAAIPTPQSDNGATRELAARVRRRAAECLRARLAADESLETTPGGALHALLWLAAGADPSERVVRLARAAAEHVAKELGDAPQRTPLVFGYAVHPDEAAGADALRTRAARPRIRML